MKLLPALFLLLIPALSRGERHETFCRKAIKLQLTSFFPKYRYFLFTGSYTSPRAVLSAAASPTGLSIRSGNGISLKDTSISISHHSYEQETGKGIFSLGLLVKDRPFPQDGRIQIKGKVPVKCARLATLPETEIDLRPNAAYSIPLCISSFLEEGTDVANLEKCPHLDIRVNPYTETNTWSIGLIYPVSFPYAGMVFLDRERHRIPVKTEMARCRSGPIEFHPFTCTFPEKYDRVRLVIHYAEKQETRNLPINAAVSREDALKAMPPHPEGGRIPGQPSAETAHLFQKRD